MSEDIKNTKKFHLGDVLSITTGRLLSREGIGGIYKILNHMQGEELYTHQLPRIGRQAAPVLLKLYPQFAEETADDVTEDNKEWLDERVAKYGEYFEVPQFAFDEVEHIDPISELVELVHPSKIIIVSKN